MYQRNSQPINPTQQTLQRAGTMVYGSQQPPLTQQNPFARAASGGGQPISKNCSPQFMFDPAAEKFSFTATQQRPPIKQSNPFTQQQKGFSFTQSYQNSGSKVALQSTPQRPQINSYVRKADEAINTKNQHYSDEDEEEAKQGSQEEQEDEEQDEEHNEEEEEEDEEEDEDEEEEEEEDEEDQPQYNTKGTYNTQDTRKTNKEDKANKQKLAKIKEKEESKNYRSLAQISKIMSEVTNVNKELDQLEQDIENSLLESRVRFNQELTQNLSLSQSLHDSDDPEFDNRSSFSYSRYLQEFKQFQEFQKVQKQSTHTTATKFPNFLDDENDFTHKSTEKSISGQSSQKVQIKKKLK